MGLLSQIYTFLFYIFTWLIALQGMFVLECVNNEIFSTYMSFYYDRFPIIAEVD